MAAIDPTKKYPIILSSELLGKPSKETFTGVKLNHRPTLSSDTAPSSSRIKPATKDGSFTMTFDDQPGKKYQYNGVRTTDDGKFVLIFDPKRQALVLHRVDSTFHMNLVRTPTDTSEVLRKKFPQLEIKDSNTIASSSSPSSAAAASRKQKPSQRPQPKAKPGSKVINFKPKQKRDAPASAPPPLTRMRPKAPANIAIPKSNAKRNTKTKAADNKKPPAAASNISLTLPGAKAAPASSSSSSSSQPKKKPQPQQVSLALPTIPEKKEEPQKKSKKRAADSEDEDEDDDDDDFGLTIEYPDAAPSNTTSNNNTLGTAALNRRFSEFNHKPEYPDEQDLEQHFAHFKNDGYQQEEEDDDEEDIAFQEVPIKEPPRVVVKEPEVFTFDDGDDSDDEGDGGGQEEDAAADIDLDWEAELVAEFLSLKDEVGEQGGHGSDSEVSEEE